MVMVLANIGLKFSKQNNKIILNNFIKNSFGD
ncbi:hypothetical protein cco113_09799 [Campylobacter coli 2688]|nr:hypothetical protein cco113_09799 [Campylobacter coli 2688]